MEGQCYCMIMEFRLVTTEAELDELERDWNDLADRTSASYFSSFEYVRTAWTHFHGPADRLSIVVVSDGATIVGIAPLYVTLTRRLRIPCRVLRLIATWEGDRPQILADGDREEVCRQVITFLTRRHRGWDILELREQPVQGVAGRGWGFLPGSGLYWQITPDAVGQFVPREGSWDDYLKTLSFNARHDFRRRNRRLQEAHADAHFECLTDPERIREALDRFVAIEGSSWKGDAGIGVGRDPRHYGFYADLCRRLAKRNALRIDFLRAEGADIAALVSFVHGHVIYVRHTTYSPRYAKFSPGVLLLAELLRQFFSSGLAECDLLGMNQQQRHKAQWARGQRETVALRAYRKLSRVTPWLTARALYYAVRRVAPWVAAARSGRSARRDSSATCGEE